MRFEQFYYFVKIADLHSFSAASSYLFVSQQALSTSIKNLENEFQTTLFVRTPRGVVLSEEGQYFYDVARKMLSLYEDLHYHYLIEPEHQKKSEIVNIALNSSIKAFYFSKIISYFYKTFPSCDVNYITMKNDDIISAVQSHEVDLGVLPILKINNQLRTDIPEDLQFYPFHEGRISLLTSIDSPLAQFKSVSLSTVVKYPLILNDFSINGESLFRQVIEHTCPNPNIIMADSSALLTQLVEDNIGHTISLDSYPLPSKNCIKIPITDNVSITAGFLHGNASLSEFQKLYIDKAINLIEKNLQS